MTTKENKPSGEVWQIFREWDEKTGTIRDQMEDLAFKKGKLDSKTKYLIATALASALGSLTGVETYATHAKQAGAQDEEIFEVMRVVYLLGGNRALASSIRGLVGVIEK